MTLRTPHWTRSALRATIAIPSLRSLRGVRVPQQAPFERNRKAVSFFFLKSFSNPLTLFSPCTTFACRSDGENSLFRHFVPYGGSSPSRGPRRKYFRWGCFRRQKTPRLEVFFLALSGDMNPARFARFRRSRNDTADTALDAIGTPCSDRYSVTSFLTGVRVPLGVPAESIFGGVVSGARKHLVSRCFFSPCLGT